MSERDLAVADVEEGPRVECGCGEGLGSHECQGRTSGLLAQRPITLVLMMINSCSYCTNDLVFN